MVLLVILFNQQIFALQSKGYWTFYLCNVQPQTVFWNNITAYEIKDGILKLYIYRENFITKQVALDFLLTE